MTSLNNLLANYTLEEEFSINECSHLESNKYNAYDGCGDIIF